MAAITARFQVDSRLARLLSQEYPSTEKALKELVDNAWDADAENVHISLPAPMTDTPIGRRQLPWPPGDNYPGRWKRGLKRVGQVVERAFRGAGASPCWAARRR